MDNSLLNQSREIAIEVGDKCNFNCAHCGDGVRQNSRLSENEIRRLRNILGDDAFKNVLFVGGETTLYIRDINRIISHRSRLFQGRIAITTNGYFATSVSAASKVLASFLKLNSVQLSYDKFHCKFLPFANVKNLRKACLDLGINFSVLTAIQDPLDLLLLEKLWALGGVKVGISKVLPLGNAKTNNMGMRYPSFDRGVLARKCPSRAKLVYLGAKGFTSCCSILTRNSRSRAFFSGTVPGFYKKPFHRLISGHNFRSLAKRFGADLEKTVPEWSNPCVICSHIFSGKGAKRWLMENSD